MIDTIRSERNGAIVTLKIDRQDKKNALTTEMYSALTAQIQAAVADSSVRVLLLSGEGPDFSSGNDLVDFIANPPKDESAPVFQFINAVRTCPKPVVAAVEGLAVGIGTTILLHCDLVYAASNARFKMPFVDLGVTPEAGSSWILPKNFGYQRAAELMLLCPIFDADTASKAGFVTRVVEPGKALEAATQAATQVASKPPAALRAAKELMKRDGDTLAERLKVEADVFAQGLQGEEFKEAVDAFKNKRKPDFSRFS